MTIKELEAAFENRDMETQEKETFIIDTREKAEWAAQKIAFAQKRIDDRTAEIKRLKDRLDDRLKEINNADVRLVDWFTADLQPFVSNVLEGQKKKSENFAFARAGYRSVGGSVEIVDEEAAIAWLEENHPEAVKKTVSKTEVKKITEDVPGIQLSPKEDRFYVSPDYKLLSD